MVMLKPIEVKALPDYKIWIKYPDGAAGEVDLSHLAGRGVFKFWDDYQNFQTVYIADDGAITWNDQVDLCPDSIYLRLTGKSPEEIFPNLQSEKVDA
jgi:hypothetical protein